MFVRQSELYNVVMKAVVFPVPLAEFFAELARRPCVIPSTLPVVLERIAERWVELLLVSSLVGTGPTQHGYEAGTVKEVDADEHLVARAEWFATSDSPAPPVRAARRVPPPRPSGPAAAARARGSMRASPTAAGARPACKYGRG